MFTRRIDDLGRIVIPKKLRNRINVKEGDTLAVIPNGNSIILRKCSDNCLDEIITDFTLLEDTKLGNMLMNVIDEYKRSEG